MIKFVSMRSIKKDYKKQSHDDYCSDWIATEKIHGSSFQFYTADGITVKRGGRCRDLSHQATYVNCDIIKLQIEYEEYVRRCWQEIKSNDRWVLYREANYLRNEEGVMEVETPDGECHVRIYGELYGGGGVATSDKMAIQKEIIYTDECRFYVFAITVNRSWMTVAEMNGVCLKAGFPYYGQPVCEPKESTQALIDFLVDSGAIDSVSDFTDHPEGNKCFVEGFVLTPLTRPDADFRHHSIKFLSPKFLDVRETGSGETKTVNYCTQQRYHSVISKLDIHERMDTQLVADMFLEDIIKELPKNYHFDEKMKSMWVSNLLGWLAEDEYFTFSEENCKLEALEVGASAGAISDENVNHNNNILPEILESFVLTFNEKQNYRNITKPKHKIEENRES